MTDFVLRLEAVVYDRPHQRDVIVRLKDRQYGEHFEFTFTYEQLEDIRGAHRMVANAQVGHMARIELSKMWSPQP